MNAVTSGYAIAASAAAIVAIYVVRAVVAWRRRRQLARWVWRGGPLPHAVPRKRSRIAAAVVEYRRFR